MVSAKFPVKKKTFFSHFTGFLDTLLVSEMPNLLTTNHKNFKENIN